MVLLFDRFRLDIPPKLKYYEDGAPGKRVVFITDRSEKFIVTFEEGMRMMDMNPGSHDGKPAVSFQCFKFGKYIHQRRIDSTKSNEAGGYAFFHIEVEDANGETLYLPGQMTAKPGYVWSDGVEPVLMQLMEGVTLRDS